MDPREEPRSLTPAEMALLTPEERLGEIRAILLAAGSTGTGRRPGQAVWIPAWAWAQILEITQPYAPNPSPEMLDTIKVGADPVELGTVVARSFFRQRDSVTQLEEVIEAILDEHVTHRLNPYPADWPMSFHCLDFVMVEGNKMLAARGIWSSGYLGDEGEEANLEVPVALLAPLAGRHWTLGRGRGEPPGPSADP